MKRCSFCGKEFPDSVDVCPTDVVNLDDVTEGQPATSKPDDEPEVPVMSPAEERFWSRLTLRQLAIVLIRLQAICFLVYAVLDLTYLPAYFRRINDFRPDSSIISTARFDLLLAILRIALNAAAGFALLLHTERFLSWLVKDIVEAESARKTAESPPGETAESPTGEPQG